jgi:hypothetical protein
MDTQTDSNRLTRRTWLQGTALVALYAWAAAGARAAAPALGNLHADAIVIDAGLPEATSLARGARTQAHVEMLDDDVAELFYGRLSPIWRERGVRGLAGLTRASALFLLQPLVSEYGLRTVGLRRTPEAGCAALVSLCDEQVRRPMSPEPVQKALLEEDHAVFAWWMAPVHPPLHAGVAVIPT